MRTSVGAAIGAVAGFALQAVRYVGAVPDGATVDFSGLAGFGASGALFGAIGGVVVAAVLRLFQR